VQRTLEKSVFAQLIIPVSFKIVFLRRLIETLIIPQRSQNLPPVITHALKKKHHAKTVLALFYLTENLGLFTSDVPTVQ
jgi:hypothetical protein